MAPGTCTLPGTTEPTFAYDVTNGTTFYVSLDAYVVQSNPDAFPQGETFMFMWDFALPRAGRTGTSSSGSTSMASSCPS